MKCISATFILGAVLLLVSCVTWVREERNEKVTHGLTGAIMEIRQTSVICLNTQSRLTKFSTGYLILPLDGNSIPENRRIIEKCPPGTRGRIVRFFKERDAGQFIWDYVEFEMDDPRLKKKYRIVRMIGLQGDDRYAPWNPNDGDFRIIDKTSR